MIDKNSPRSIVERGLYQTSISASRSQRKIPTKIVGFVFEKVLDFLSLLWYVAQLTGGANRRRITTKQQIRHR